MGRFGLLEPDSFAITGSSVEGGPVRFDLHSLLQRPVEGAPRDGPLEARHAVAGIGPATGFGRPRYEPPVPRDEPQELALRSLPPTPDAAPRRLAHGLVGETWFPPPERAEGERPSRSRRSLLRLVRRLDRDRDRVGAVGCGDVRRRLRFERLVPGRLGEAFGPDALGLGFDEVRANLERR